jgi:Uma2 family endonuclease
MGRVDGLTLSWEEYLRLEEASPERHELVEGVPYAMAGASKAHNLLVGNLAFLLRPAARAKGCRVYTETVRLRLGERTAYYPDLMVVCTPSPDPFQEEAPCLVVEVLSSGTRRTDLTEKKERYLALPSLQGYLLVDAARKQVLLYRRLEAGWALEAFGEGERVDLPCLETPLPVDAVYEGVPLEVE